MSSITPLISVIVPVYNASDTLHRCMDSLLAQSFKDFELIAVNDGSIDKSWEILQHYAKIDNRVRIINKPNGGVSSARNAALEEAKGEWIAFCDSDDFVEPEWLENFITTDTEVDLVIQGIIYEHNDNKSSRHILKTASGETLESKRNLIAYLISKGVFGYPVTKLFKSSIITNYTIRFNTTSHFREDEEFLSTYLVYVKSWQTSDKAAYHYILPYKGKCYKGISYQSLVPIFRNLDTIFDKHYPAAIADIHANNIKGMIIQKCCNGEIPTEYECDLYRRLFQAQSKSRGGTLINRLLLSSHKNTLSRHTLVTIHTLSNLIK